ncbi:unnamed protein product [Calypogeia fissa]
MEPSFYGMLTFNWSDGSGLERIAEKAFTIGIVFFPALKRTLCTELKAKPFLLSNALAKALAVSDSFNTARKEEVISRIGNPTYTANGCNALPSPDTACREANHFFYRKD